MSGEQSAGGHQGATEDGGETTFFGATAVFLRLGGCNVMNL